MAWAMTFGIQSSQVSKSLGQDKMERSTAVECFASIDKSLEKLQLHVNRFVEMIELYYPLMDNAHVSEKIQPLANETPQDMVRSFPDSPIPSHSEGSKPNPEKELPKSDGLLVFDKIPVRVTMENEAENHKRGLATGYDIAENVEVLEFEAPLINCEVGKVLELTIGKEVTKSEELDALCEEFELEKFYEKLEKVGEKLIVSNEKIFELSSEENEMLKLPTGEELIEIANGNDMKKQTTEETLIEVVKEIPQADFGELHLIQRGNELILNLCLLEGFDIFPTLLCANVYNITENEEVLVFDDVLLTNHEFRKVLEFQNTIQKDAYTQLAHNTSNHVIVSNTYPLFALQPKWRNDKAHMNIKTSKYMPLEDQPCYGYFIINGIIKFKGRVYLGKSSDLRLKTIQNLYDSSIVGHSGEVATYQRLKTLLYWLGLDGQVVTCIQNSEICKRLKHENSPHEGLMEFLQIPKSAWSLIYMDPIEGLPKLDGEHIFLVVIGKDNIFTRNFLIELFKLIGIVVDFKRRVGKFKSTGSSLHTVPGCDVAGVVLKVLSEVKGIKEGDELYRDTSEKALDGPFRIVMVVPDSTIPTTFASTLFTRSLPLIFLFVQKNCILEVADDFYFDARDLWSIVFPSDSEKIVTTARSSNEVVYTKAKVITEHGVMNKCISENLLYFATVTSKVCALTTAYFHPLCVLGKRLVEQNNAAATWLRIQLKHYSLFYATGRYWDDFARKNISWENLDDALISFNQVYNFSRAINGTELFWDPWGQGSTSAGGNVMTRIISSYGKEDGDELQKMYQWLLGEEELCSGDDDAVPVEV